MVYGVLGFKTTSMGQSARNFPEMGDFGISIRHGPGGQKTIRFAGHFAAENAGTISLL
jgi:hypothetical protein